METFKFVFCLFFLIGCSKGTTEIIPLTPYIYKESNQVSHKESNYAVKNFTLESVDRYVEKTDKSDRSQYDVFIMRFYKYGMAVNEKTPHDLDSPLYWQKDALLCTYNWYKGKPIGKYVYEDGKLLRIDAIPEAKK